MVFLPWPQICILAQLQESNTYLFFVNITCSYVNIEKLVHRVFMKFKTSVLNGISSLKSILPLWPKATFNNCNVLSIIILVKVELHFVH